ncbi:tetratricopeptide repeat protein [Bradyrhizobium sp.]|uniref:SEL1-like repeat protein n=1 Tax=Bradyrhizobium sp. TaxID=376 RepID=UPI002382E5CD|nr:tetratricopeptide repeat protein [Bradyrhizobium sp.]MDE2379280.1 tetratricopeptide repeat protein [Bradyrhizobium sp.]
MLRALFIVAIIALSSAGTSRADDAGDARMTEDYLRQAQRGDTRAQFYLGVLYAQGVGVSRSDAEAFRWLSSAAERGHAQARLIVGEMYAVGRGTSRSDIDAYKWASAAAASSNPADTQRNAQRILDLLTGRMTGSDVSEAKRLAQSLTPSTSQFATNRPSDGRTDEITTTDRRRGAEYDRLTDAINRNPQDADAYYKRGNILARLKEYDLAANDFGRAIEYGPGNAQAYNNRCFVYVALGRGQMAVTDCNEALRLRPDYADALDSRGLANLMLGRLDPAIADFNDALRLRPKLATSLYGRGIAYTRQGRTSAGNSDMKAATAIDPGVRDELDSYGIR